MVNKRAVSLMISYILLISLAIIMGIIVFQYLRTYVPAEVPECPDDASLMITDFTCLEAGISLTFKNNGLFNIDGYFIRGREDPSQELATIELSDSSLGYVAFTSPLEPDQETAPRQFPLDLTQIHSIDIIPIRIQLDEKKIETVVSCSDSKITEKISDCYFDE